MNLRIVHAPLAFALGLSAGLAPALPSAEAKAPPGRYVLLEDGAVVHDTVTGLQWLARALGQLEHAEAQAACAEHTVGALKGFRLPRRDQLITIMDTANRVVAASDGLTLNDNVAVDLDYFDAQRGGYWTDTAVRLGPPPPVELWFVVGAERGDVFPQAGVSGSTAWVRCVRVARPGQP
jgi:Protein of unknown function (DUF1566)